MRRLSHSLKSLTRAAGRYPLSALLLLVCAALTVCRIAGFYFTDIYLIQLACALGAAAGFAAQSASERLVKGRGPLIILAIFAAVLYYLWARSWPEVMAARFMVLAALLTVAGVWLPTAKSRFAFYENFTAAFKALFQAAFFSGVLFAGCAAVAGAVDFLITPVDPDVFGYLAAVIFVFIAPMLFLSLIPLVPALSSGSEIETIRPDDGPAEGRRDGDDEAGENSGEEGRGENLSPEPGGADSAAAEERAAPDEAPAGRAFLRGVAARVDAISEYERRTALPPFLRALLTFILIPVAFVFTLILIVYILRSLGTPFWEDNLLEPLLISYCAGVIVLLLLVPGLDSATALAARRVLPVTLIAVALFQIVASALSAREEGLTHGRYFVLAFGALAVISGVVLTLRPRRGTGLVAVAFLLIGIISLIPPVDAFSTGVGSQRRLLEAALAEEGLLRSGALVPAADVSEASRRQIVSSLEYLYRLGRLEDIPWLPEGFDPYSDASFRAAFGFSRYAQPGTGFTYSRAFFAMDAPVNIAGYQAAAVFEYPAHVDRTLVFDTPSGQGTLRLRQEEEDAVIELLSGVGDAGARAAALSIGEIFERIDGAADATLTLEEASFSAQGELGRLLVVMEMAERYESGGWTSDYARLHVFAALD